MTAHDVNDVMAQSDTDLTGECCLRAASQDITVAEIFPDLTSRKIIVSEWVEGEGLSRCKSDDVRALCSSLLNCYLIQVRDSSRMCWASLLGHGVKWCSLWCSGVGCSRVGWDGLCASLLY